jgi:GAF domain-containing protein/tetratricopeptide (TPR) repeat protein
MTDATATQPARKRANKGRRPAPAKSARRGSARPAGAPRGDGAPAAVIRVADLARAGQHAQAIDAATAALADAGSEVAVRLDFLDLRAESFVALGELERANADAAAMLELAIAAKSPALKAQALNREALVQIRKWELKAAIKTANAALKHARQSKSSRLIAMSLFRLAEAQYREKPGDQVLKNAMEAAELFRTLGAASGQGRALWVVAMYHGFQGRAAEGNRAANDALALCRSCGDLYGAGNALNMLLFHEADLAAALRLSSLALADFEASGYIERQGVVTANMGIIYASLGLHRRARRLYLKAIELYRRVGTKAALGNVFSSLIEAELAMRHFENARGYIAEMARFAEDSQSPLLDATLAAVTGRLALLEGEPGAALHHFKLQERIGREIDRVAIAIDGLTSVGETSLALGKARAALVAMRRATELHKAHDLTALDGMFPASTWWQHCRALRANKKDEAAREALETAYGFVRKGIAGLSDEGLRRNYLNKNETHRAIVAAWLADARKRKLSAERRSAYLAGEASLKEPFERLVDTGLRLNELRSAEELHEFLIDEATELSGAERVLLVLEGPRGLRLAGSLMPRGEDANALLGEIGVSLADVRRTRTASLAYTPAGSSELEQRSTIIAPLIAQRQLLGYLYADLDGAFGRFRESDRDLLGMLASQAAVALDNAQWSHGLEQKVTQRTEELNASNAKLEQRANELAIINAVQSGLASQLDIQAIFDLVGDKLRDTFDAQSVSIYTYDRQTNLMHFRYLIEKGERQFQEPIPLRGFGAKVVGTRQPLMISENMIARAAEAGSTIVGGGEAPKSGIWVPLIIGDEARGVISIQNIDRENAFTDSDFRLLITLAASLSVTFENARLFDETQHLLKETEQRAAELAVINRIQEGMAAELDFQAITDLVGDKLREVFSTGDIGINWWDERANQVHYLYAFEHGVRLTIPPATPKSGGSMERTLRTREILVANTLAEQEAAGIANPVPGTDQSIAIVRVPIVGSDRVLGTMQLENYEREHAFGEAEIRLLTTVAASMGVAWENARLFDETQRLLKETEQRAAELAIINSVQEGLASKLEMQAIHDLVGNKIREIFEADVVGISLYDAESDLSRFAFLLDHGERFHPEPGAPRGFTAHILRTKKPIVIHTVEELDRRMAELGAKNIGGATVDNSFIYVPILHGDTASGVICVGKQREHAFSDSDVSLLTTLGNAMSVALENARLFDETQRLLKETEQRAAELAVINRIQEGMAAELDFQAIVDLVGDKLRVVFQTGDIGIRWHDPKANLSHYVYQYEHGVRLHPPPTTPSPGGPWSRMVETRQSLVANNPGERQALGITTIPGTDTSLSLATVPILGGDRVLGTIALENYERENAFGEAEVRLLSTVAASMGVALENARLFDETQHLLKETEQRAAELAVINRIQEGMAAELDFQAIVDLVGDKLREVFKTGDIGIRWYDAANNKLLCPYDYEHGVRIGPPVDEPFVLERMVALGGNAAAGDHQEPGGSGSARCQARSGNRSEPFVGARSHPRQ